MGDSRSPRFVVKEWIFLSLVLVLTVGIYLAGLNGGFVFDDTHTVEGNNLIRIDSLEYSQLYQAAWSFLAGTRPLSMLSFAINNHFIAHTPYAYKVVNLAIHLFVGILLFVFVKQLVAFLFGRPEPDGNSSFGPSPALHYLPLTTVSLWLVAPINLTSVLYISQRMTSLAALFTLLGLISYMQGRTARIRTGQGGYRWFTVTLFCGVAAFLSKENGLLLGLYLLVVESVVFRFRNRRGHTDRLVAGTAIAFIFLSAWVMLLFGHRIAEWILAGYTAREFNFEQRMLTEARALWFYFRQIVVPNLAELGLWHDDFAISTSVLEPPGTLPALLGLAVLTGGAFFLIRRTPIISLGVLWFLAGHAMESTFLALEIMHEHRNYLPSFGILFAIFGLLLGVASIRLRLKLILVVGVLSLYAATTAVRAYQWGHPVRLDYYEAMHHPRSALAQYSYGRTLLISAELGGELVAEEGIKRVLEAMRLSPISIMPEITLLTKATVHGEAVKEDWFNNVYTKLESYPFITSNWLSLKKLMECQVAESCPLPVEKVDKIFDIAGKKNHSEAVNIAAFYYVNAREDFYKANLLFQRAVELSPESLVYRLNYAEILIKMGKIEEAKEQYEIALQAPKRSLVRLEEKYKRIGELLESYR